MKKLNFHYYQILSKQFSLLPCYFRGCDGNQILYNYVESVISDHLIDICVDSFDTHSRIIIQAMFWSNSTGSGSNSTRRKALQFWLHFTHKCNHVCCHLLILGFSQVWYKRKSIFDFQIFMKLNKFRIAHIFKYKLIKLKELLYPS